jgi:putative transposase
MATHSYMEAHKRKHKKSYLCQKAKLLYNAALFRIRQIFTGWDKDSRTDNEKEAFAEVTLLQQTYPSIKVKRVISYCHLEKLIRVTHNPQSLPLL